MSNIGGIATCIGCGCDDLHACCDSQSGRPCSWLAVDYSIGKGVCTSCENHIERWKAGDMEIHRDTGTEGIDPVQILSMLEHCRFRFNDERDLQDGIAQVMSTAGVKFEREKVLGPQDRPDFLIGGSIAMEIKIKGSIAEALRQIDRYTGHQAVEAVLLVGTPGWLSRVPSEIRGKPVFSLRLTGSLL